MNPVIVRNLKIGEGIPKICVPIAEKSFEDIVNTANLIIESQADLVEWRVDWFENAFDFEKIEMIIEKLREILGEKPLLFTFRTKSEGGEKAIDDTCYKELYKKVIDTGYVDLIDVEGFQNEETAKELIAYAHQTSVKVIVSSHDFEKTPEENILLERLKVMQEMDADILKIAVMPKTKADVITLMSVTEKMVSKYASKPIISMSMSDIGVVSRLAGELSGSAITFGNVGRASAPGQISACELKKILEQIHGIYNY